MIIPFSLFPFLFLFLFYLFFFFLLFLSSRLFSFLFSFSFSFRTSTDSMPQIISASGDKTIRVWDKEREKETNVMRDHFSQSIVCMQADPRKIVCGSYDKSVKIFHFGKPFF